MSRYRELAAMPEVLRILASGLLARLPLGMSGLALVLAIRERGGSFALAGLASGALSAANAIVSPLQGRLIRRLGPARTVRTTAVAQSLMLAAVALATQNHVLPAVLVVLAFLAGALVPPISACSRSLWPLVVPDQELLEATYALDAISQELLWTCGPLLVALATTLESAVLGLWIAAAFTLVGGLTFASMPSLRAGAPARRRPDEQALLSNAIVLAALAAMTGLGLADGSLTLGLTALASQLGAPAASGAFLGMLSLGSVVGGVLHGSRSWRWSTWTRFRGLLGCTAVLVLPLCLASTIIAALLLASVAGLAMSALMSCQFAVINETTDPARRAEAFSLNTAALAVGVAAGTFLAGELVKPLGSRGPFLLSATFFVVAMVVTLLAGGVQPSALEIDSLMVPDAEAPGGGSLAD